MKLCMFKQAWPSVLQVFNSENGMTREIIRNTANTIDFTIYHKGVSTASPGLVGELTDSTKNFLAPETMVGKRAILFYVPLISAVSKAVTTVSRDITALAGGNTIIQWAVPLTTPPPLSTPYICVPQGAMAHSAFMLTDAEYAGLNSQYGLANPVELIANVYADAVDSSSDVTVANLPAYTYYGFTRPRCTISIMTDADIVVSTEDPTISGGAPDLISIPSTGSPFVLDVSNIDNVGFSGLWIAGDPGPAVVSLTAV